MFRVGLGAVLALALFAASCPTPSRHSSAMRLESEPAGEICRSGGVALLVGPDENDNGELEDEEVESRHYVCNGETPEPPMECSSGVCTYSGDLTVTGDLTAEGAGIFDELATESVVIDGTVWHPDCPVGYDLDETAGDIVLCYREVAHGRRDEMVAVGDFWVDQYEASIWFSHNADQLMAEVFGIEDPFGDGWVQSEAKVHGRPPPRPERPQIASGLGVRFPTTGPS